MNIFVSILSNSTTSEGLIEIFQQFGEVKEAKVIMDRETGMSKGYGFVEMANGSDGQNAIAELNDSELDGSVIVVKESAPKTGGRPGGGGGSRGGFGGGSGGGNKFSRPGGFSGGGGDRNRDRGGDFNRGGYRSREDNNSYN